MSKKTLAWIYLILLGLIWGSSFILMKRGMHALDGTALFNSTQVATLRMLIAGVVLLPLTIYNIKKIKRIKDILFFACVGFFGNFFPSFLFTYAETGLSSGLTGVMNSLTPIFTIFIGFFIFKQTIKSYQLAGVLIAAIGVVLLILGGEDVSFSGNLPQIIAVALATLCYAISVNVVKYTLQDYKAMEIASIAFGTTLIPSVIITYFSGSVDTLITIPQAKEGLFFISILSLAGTAIALYFFNKLIAISSTLFASSVTYIIPIVAVFIGLQFGEKIHLLQFLAMGVVLGGVFLVNYQKTEQ
ncbi:MAG: DMT family transporter [Crocinitomicaceae bacterium]|nr:DMT family transporter [Crocinitomicaceae bacterium]